MRFPPSGGTLLFPTGTYKFCGASIRLRSNTIVRGVGATITADRGCGGYTTIFSNSGCDVDDSNGQLAIDDTTWYDPDLQNENIIIEGLVFKGSPYACIAMANVRNLQVMNNRVIGGTGGASATATEFVVLLGAVDGALIQGNDVYGASFVYAVTGLQREREGSPTEYQAIRKVRIVGNQFTANTGAANEAINLVGWYGDLFDAVVSANTLRIDAPDDGLWGVTIGHENLGVDGSNFDESSVHDVIVSDNVFSFSIETKSNIAEAVRFREASSAGFRVHDVMVRGNTMSGTTLRAIDLIGALQDVAIQGNAIRDGETPATQGYAIYKNSTSARRVNVIGNLIRDYGFSSDSSLTTGGIHISAQDCVVADNVLENINNAEGAASGIAVDNVSRGTFLGNVIRKSGDLQVGIYFLAAGNSNRCAVANNVLDGMSTGIILNGAFDCNIDGNTISNCTDYAFDINNSVSINAGNLIQNCVLTNNSAAVAPAGWVADSIAAMRNMFVDGVFYATRYLVSSGAGYLESAEVSGPSSPATNRFRLYAEDNGSGKTRLMVVFGSGAAQQIAIEP